MHSKNSSRSTDSRPTRTSHESRRSWHHSFSKYRMMKQEGHTPSLDSFGRWERTHRATAQHSLNPHTWELTKRQSTAMTRPLSVRVRKLCTKKSVPTEVPTRRRSKRLHSSSSLSSKTHGYRNLETRRQYIRTSRQMRCLPTSKRGGMGRYEIELLALHNEMQHYHLEV